MLEFWNDAWCAYPRSITLNLPQHVSQNLTATIANFIHEGQWNIPQVVQAAFPNMRFLVQQVALPIEYKHDKLIWKNSITGELTFKDAFMFKSQNGQNI